MMQRDVEERQIEIGIEELVGGAAAPDLSEEIAQRFKRGDTVHRSTRPASRLLTAAMLLIGLATVVGVGLTEKWAQDPKVELEPLAMRRVFYAKDDPSLFEVERIRLLAWLSCGNRWSDLQEHPEHIHWFNRAPSKLGGPVTGRIHWYPKRVGSSSAISTEIGKSGPRVVPLFDLARLEQRSGREDLIELIPVDNQAFACTAKMLDPNAMAKSIDPQGNQVLTYAVFDEHRAAYRSWSKQDTNRIALILNDGIGISAPKFITEIAGRGAVRGLDETVIDQIMKQVLGEREASVLTPIPAGPSVKDIIDQERRAKELARGNTSGLNFKQLAAWLAKAEKYKDLPAELRRLDGVEVELSGFLLPSDSGRAELVASMWKVGFAESPEPKYTVQIAAVHDLSPFRGRYCRVSGKLDVLRGGEAVWRPLLIENAKITLLD